MEPATMSDLKDLMKELREELRESIREAVAEAFGNSKPALEHATTSTASQLLAMDAKVPTRACSSPDQGRSALDLAPTATIDVLLELAAPTHATCSTKGHGHETSGDGSMVVSLIPWGMMQSSTASLEASRTQPCRLFLALELDTKAHTRCSIKGYVETASALKVSFVPRTSCPAAPSDNIYSDPIPLPWPPWAASTVFRTAHEWAWSLPARSRLLDELSSAPGWIQSSWLTPHIQGNCSTVELRPLPWPSFKCSQVSILWQLEKFRNHTKVASVGIFMQAIIGDNNNIYMPSFHLVYVTGWEVLFCLCMGCDIAYYSSNHLGHQAVGICPFMIRQLGFPGDELFFGSAEIMLSVCPLECLQSLRPEPPWLSILTNVGIEVEEIGLYLVVGQRLQAGYYFVGIHVYSCYYLAIKDATGFLQIVQQLGNTELKGNRLSNDIGEKWLDQLMFKVRASELECRLGKSTRMLELLPESVPTKAHATNFADDIHPCKFMEHLFRIIHRHDSGLASSYLFEKLYHIGDLVYYTWERWCDSLGHCIRILLGQFWCWWSWKQESDDSGFSKHLKLFHDNIQWLSELSACTITVALVLCHSCLAIAVVHLSSCRLLTEGPCVLLAAMVSLCATLRNAERLLGAETLSQQQHNRANLWNLSCWTGRRSLLLIHAYLGGFCRLKWYIRITASSSTYLQLEFVVAIHIQFGSKEAKIQTRAKICIGKCCHLIPLYDSKDLGLRTAARGLLLLPNQDGIPSACDGVMPMLVDSESATCESLAWIPHGFVLLCHSRTTLYAAQCADDETTRKQREELVQRKEVPWEPGDFYMASAVLTRLQLEPFQGGRGVTVLATFFEQAPVGHHYYFDSAATTTTTSTMPLSLTLLSQGMSHDVGPRRQGVGVGVGLGSSRVSRREEC